jgi:hypothetical protein
LANSQVTFYEDKKSSQLVKVNIKFYQDIKDMQIYEKFCEDMEKRLKIVNVKTNLLRH